MRPTTAADLTDADGDNIRSVLTAVAGTAPEWILIHRSTDKATFYRNDGESAHFYMTDLTKGANGWTTNGHPEFGQGTWANEGWQNCVHAVGRTSAESADTFTTPRLKSTDTSFVAQLTELSGTCTTAVSGQPVIVYSPDTVVVTFFVTQTNCSEFIKDTPQITVPVQLKEPLGNRKLLDGATYPGLDPTPRDQYCEINYVTGACGPIPSWIAKQRRN